MPTFRYRGRTSDGRVVEGELESPDRAGAIRLVELKRCIPLRVEPAGALVAPVGGGVEKRRAAARPAGPAASPGREKPKEAPVRSPQPRGSIKASASQRLLFTEQLAYLLSTNMKLDQALGVLSRRLKQPALNRLTNELHQAVVDGQSFSQALAEHPKIFSPLYVNLTQAGEAAGALSDVLTRLVQHLNEMKQVRDRVRQALVYPAFLALVGVSLVIVFVTMMVPQLTELFRTVGGALPLPTQLLIQAHHLITTYWWVAAGLALLTWVGYRSVVRTPAGRKVVDRAKLSVPGFGDLIRFRFFAQFARTLHTLMKNGVNLLRAMELLEDVAENAYVSSRLAEARAMLVEGTSLSVSLGRLDLFPGMFIDMMSVGEQAGQLAETTGMVATIYERELDHKVKLVSALIPPLITVVIAVMIGSVVFGILSAVFSITSGLQTR